MRITGTGQPPVAVTIAEFKAATPMAESDDFDQGLTAIIAAATATVETATRRPLALREVEIMAPVTSGPWLRFWFPVAPVSAISAVDVFDGSAWVTLDAAEYSLEFAHDEPQLVLAQSVRSVWPNGLVRITASVGHDSAAIPAGLKQAVILIAQEWHGAGAGIGDAVTEVRSFAAHNLIRQARYQRPRTVC